MWLPPHFLTLFVCFLLCLFVCLFVLLFICLFVCLFVRLVVCLFVCLLVLLFLNSFPPLFIFFHDTSFFYVMTFDSSIQSQMDFFLTTICFSFALLSTIYAALIFSLNYFNYCYCLLFCRMISPLNHRWTGLRFLRV